MICLKHFKSIILLSTFTILYIMLLTSKQNYLGYEYFHFEVETSSDKQTHPFGEFLIENREKCLQDKFDFLVLIHSDPYNFKNRLCLRTYSPKNFLHIFLLGVKDNRIQPLIDQESELYGDVVQGSFVDSYHNLTYKAIMSLIWTNLHCSNSRYVIKIDDDALINYDLVSKFYKFTYNNSNSSKPSNFKKIIHGEIWTGSLPIRNPESRWYTSEKEYPDKVYPSYLSGGGILTTMPVMVELYKQIPLVKFFWIDDVYLTGMLRINSKTVGLESIDWRFISVNQLLNLINDPEKPLPSLITVIYPSDLCKVLDAYSKCIANNCSCCYDDNDAENLFQDPKEIILTP